MALLPLLERPPWVRRGKGGALERFSGGAWQPVEAAERHRLGQQDGQVGWGQGAFLVMTPDVFRPAMVSMSEHAGPGRMCPSFQEHLRLLCFPSC